MSLKLLDVTLREVGLVNGFSLDGARAQAIVDALDRAGVDVIEVGYLRSAPPGAPPSGSYCDKTYLAGLREHVRRAKLAVMVHTGEVPLDAYANLPALGVELVRFPISARNAGSLAEHARAARAAGLGFCLNATRMTEVGIGTLIEYAELAERLGASCFYVADSSGSLYPHRLESAAAALRAAVSLPLGFHAHDNLSLAFANTLVALRHGFSWVDASLGGEGKGGGNLPIALVASYLAVEEGGTYDGFALSRAYYTLLAGTLTRQPTDRILESVAGLLDLNVEQVGKLAVQAEQRGLRVVDVLEDMLRARATSRAKDLREDEARRREDS